MKSICFFSSYFEGAKLPYSIEVYLLELSKHFKEVVLLTNTKELNNDAKEFLNKHQIQVMLIQNEGFDFGMWYKAFQKFPITSYEQVALVNDSTLLFAPLSKFMNWAAQAKLDCCGFSESYAISFHIQSYFLLLNAKAIQLSAVYFEQTGILPHIKQVIEKYEVGMCSFFLEKGLKLGAYLSNKGYKGEFSPYYYLIDSHLRQGAPLIKKKIIFSSYREDELFTLIRMNFALETEPYIELIKSLHPNDLILDFKKAQMDFPNRISKYQLRVYNLKKWLFHFIKRLLRK
jgi:lipopolysaccharide biosynthesis protein